jgi:hypothetical protein
MENERVRTSRRTVDSGMEEKRRHGRLGVYGYALRTLPNIGNTPYHFTHTLQTFIKGLAEWES